ncbi:hypothetical protein ACLB1N_32095 [Escherichia coli]
MGYGQFMLLLKTSTVKIFQRRRAYQPVDSVDAIGSVANYLKAHGW